MEERIGKIPSNTAVVYIWLGKSENGQTNAAKVLRNCGMRLCFDGSVPDKHLDVDTNRELTGPCDSKCGVILLFCERLSFLWDVVKGSVNIIPFDKG